MNYIRSFYKKVFLWRHYGFAILTVAIALVVRLLLNPLIKQESPFLLFFAAVLWSAWYGGIRAGVLATTASALVSDYFFLYPKYWFINQYFGQNLQLVLFVLEGISISAVVSSLNEAQKRAELSKLKAVHHHQTLHHSEERFRLAINCMREYALFILDIDGRVVSWQAGAERIFGYQEAEIIGQNFSCIFTHEDIQSGKPEEELKAAVTKGQADDERWHIRKDGTSFWASGVIIALRDEARNLRGFSKIVRDITERKRTTEKIQASLQEKEILLKEIHHRVKNNLQIISSLLNLQSGYVDDPQIIKILKAAENRVVSMALIHEQLYQSEYMATIDFAEYIKILTDNLLSSYEINSSVVDLKLNIDNIHLSIDASIPCALIINELISNSLKYAFTPGKLGEICIDFHSENDSYLVLTVSDNGIGIPADLDFYNSETLGWQLVYALTSQLQGTVVISRNSGTEFKIKFMNL